MSINDPVLNTEPAAQTLLPRAIANAVKNIYESYAFCSLNSNTKRVLSCLIQFGLKLAHPTQAIFVKKSSIAQQLNINEATVYRALAKLEALQLIQRDKQEVIDGKIKTISKIRITQHALLLLGLTEEVLAFYQAQPRSTQAHSSSSGKKHQSPSLSTEDRLAALQDKNLNKNLQSLQKQSSENIEKRKKTTVPTDLGWLIETQHLTQGAIFKLMGVATKQGKRLSDIVQVCKHALFKVKGRALFAYLLSLIVQPTDFSYLARRNMIESQVQADKQRAIETQQLNLQQHLKPLLNRRFILANKNWVIFKDYAVEVFSAAGRLMGCCPLGKSHALIEDAYQGKLVEVT